MRQWGKSKKIENTKNKISAQNKGEHKIGATRPKVTFSGHSKNIRIYKGEKILQARKITITTKTKTKTKTKQNNKILFSRLLTLTLTASKSYELYSLSLPRQKLSLTACTRIQNLG